MQTTDYTAGEKYRELLRNQIRATGRRLIADAEKIVKDIDYMTNFEIVLLFDCETAVPTIEIKQVHINVDAYEELIKQGDKK